MAEAYIWLKQGAVKILYLTGRSSQHPAAEAYLDQRLQFFTLPFVIHVLNKKRR